MTITEKVQGLLADEHRVAAAWKMRLRCPRGHLVLNFAVVELDDGLVLTCPLSGLDKPGFRSEFAEIVDSARLRPPRATQGWIRHSDNKIGVYSRQEVTVQCPREKCSYIGAFEYFSLSAEVGAAAKSGHAEYHLTD